MYGHTLPSEIPNAATLHARRMYMSVCARRSATRTRLQSFLCYAMMLTYLSCMLMHAHRHVHLMSYAYQDAHVCSI